MASPSDPLLDERYEELATLLRESRPQASERLREQVRELGSRPVPVREPRRFGLLRLAPVAAAVLVVVAVVGGVALLSSQTSGRSEESEAAGGGDVPASAPQTFAQGQPANPDALEERALDQQAGRATAAPATAATLPPSGGRAQEYRAELSVRVPGVAELSEATSDAMRITRNLGGFVVTARYEEPGDADGDSLLVVRVPVGRVQQAITQFSQLGTILAQNISVADLQAQLDRQSDAITALERRIARLEQQLEDPTLDTETRDGLKLQLLEARRNLGAREGANAQTKRRAATARVALTLTTREEVAPPPPAEDSGFSKTLRDAVDVLAAVMTWTLAALIVASPALVLLALLFVAVRMRRRAEERRLLEA